MRKKRRLAKIDTRSKKKKPVKTKARPRMKTWLIAYAYSDQLDNYIDFHDRGITHDAKGKPLDSARVGNIEPVDARTFAEATEKVKNKYPGVHVIERYSHSVR